MHPNDYQHAQPLQKSGGQNLNGLGAQSMNSQASTQVQNQARENVRNSLAASPSFLSLPMEEQKRLYGDLYRQQVKQLSQSHSLNSGKAPIARQMASESQLRSQFNNDRESAGDLIDDSRHQNSRIDSAVDQMGDFIREVDFSGFVSDLLEGVFQANLDVTLKQMEHFQRLLKTATKDLSYFIRSIDNTAAFGYLAENNGDEFSIDFSDDEQDDSGNPAPVLTSPDGEPVDIGDNQVKAKIMDAKIQMAKEHRAMLRETLLIGVTRLVVEKGNVKASVLFDLKAKEQVQKADKAALKDQLAQSASGGFSGGLIGKIFGGPHGGGTTSRRKTRISVSSAKSEASTDLAAKLAGSVDITFKSDYFKLDNFAQMYGPNTQADRAEAGAAPAAPAR